MFKLYTVLFVMMSFISLNAQVISNVEEEKIYVAVHEKAQPYEGNKNFGEKFGSNFIIPKIYTDTGKLLVLVQFVVEKDGSLTNIIIKKDEHHLIEEVKRVFSLLPKWKPAVHDGKKVRSRLTFPVTLNVNTLELPEVSFDDKYKKSLKNFDIDNEYFSFSCNCKLKNKKDEHRYADVGYEYESVDNNAFYSLEIIDKSKYSTIDLLENFSKSFEQNNANVQDVVFQERKVKRFEMKKDIEGVTYFQKGIMYDSKENISLVYIITPYENGIDILFDEFINGLTLKK